MMQIFHSVSREVNNFFKSSALIICFYYCYILSFLKLRAQAFININVTKYVEIYSQIPNIWHFLRFFVTFLKTFTITLKSARGVEAKAK